MRGQLTRRIGELLMDMDDAPQEVLENAPRGHFAAYITPNEADFLRSQGGGVSPGGGQYMVQGIPAFYNGSPDGEGDNGNGGGDSSAGGDIGDPEGTGAGTGIGGETGAGDSSAGSDMGMGFDDPSDVGSIESPGTEADVDDPGDPGLGMEGEETAVDPVAEAEAVEAVAIAEALAMEDQVSFTSPASITLSDGTTVIGTPSEIAAMQSMVDNASNVANQPHSDLTSLQVTNAQAVQAAVTNNDITVAQAAAVMGQNISGGGQGSQSPSVGLGVNSEMGLTSINDVIDALALNAGSVNPTVGYAINDPTGLSQGSLRASQIMGNLNPTLTNAMFGLAGLIGPVGTALSMGAGALEGRGIAPALGLTEPGRGSIAEVLTDVSDTVFGAESEDSVDSAIGGEDPGEIGGPSEEELTALLTPPTTTLPDQTTTEEEEDTADTADAALPRIPSPALPPPVAPPTQAVSPVNLPPVFTEQDARLLLQQTGQLPFAGIV